MSGGNGGNGGGVLDDVETLRRAGLLMGAMNGEDPVWAGMAAVLAAFARKAAVEYGNWLSRGAAAMVLNELVGYPEALATARAYLGLDGLDGPDEEPGLATAGEPVHKATERPGSIQSVCGLDLADFFCVLDRNNLAEQWANVTCRDCRRRRRG